MSRSEITLEQLVEKLLDAFYSDAKVRRFEIRECIEAPRNLIEEGECNWNFDHTRVGFTPARSELKVINDEVLELQSQYNVVDKNPGIPRPNERKRNF